MTGGGERVVADFANGPVAKAREDHVAEAQFEVVVGVAAVEDDVVILRAGQGIGADELHAVIGGGVAFFAELERVAGPLERELREDFVDPRIAAGIAEEEEVEVAVAHVFFGDVGIVPDGEVAALFQRLLAVGWRLHLPGRAADPIFPAEYLLNPELQYQVRCHL